MAERATDRKSWSLGFDDYEDNRWRCVCDAERSDGWEAAREIWPDGMPRYRFEPLPRFDLGCPACRPKRSLEGIRADILAAEAAISGAGAVIERSAEAIKAQMDA